MKGLSKRKLAGRIGDDYSCHLIIVLTACREDAHSTVLRWIPQLVLPYRSPAPFDQRARLYLTALPQAVTTNAHESQSQTDVLCGIPTEGRR